MAVIRWGFINIKLRLFNIKEILEWADEQKKAIIYTPKKITETAYLMIFNSAFVKFAVIDTTISNKLYLTTRVISFETI